MTLSDLTSKKVAVLGFGQEGRAVIAYLKKHGITTTLFDKKTYDEFSPDDKNTIKALELQAVLGPDYLTKLSGYEVAFRSPGIWRLHPDLLAQEKRGLVITSQVKWFFEHSPAIHIGVTGTKGKGTTSTLITKILNTAFPERLVYLTGNVGKTQPLEFLDSATASDFVVYELSSFQLQDLHKSPHVAVVLMVTQEHLDHHANVAEYRAAKSSITAFQGPRDWKIVNQDFEGSLEVAASGSGTELFFSRQREASRGCYKKDSALVTAGLAPLSLLAQDPVSLIDLTKIKLKGPHNIENVAAASLAALCLGAPVEAIEAACYEFEGLPHRLELVATKSGVSYYNDSFSTVPETAIAAIRSFEEPLVVVLGGSEKYSDFTELGKVIAEKPNVKAVVLVGVTAFRIKEALELAGYKGPMLQGAKDMREIFNQVTSQTSPGDVVLLSPACASFGMFSSYIDRGNQFREIAQSLP